VAVLPPGICALEKARSLQVSQNALVRFEPDRVDEFISQSNLNSPLSYVQLVDLEDNQITEIGMEGTEKFWSLFSGVDTLRLTHNRLQKIGPAIFPSLLTLSSLDLASNNLEELPESLSLLTGLLVWDFPL